MKKYNIIDLRERNAEGELKEYTIEQRKKEYRRNKAIYYIKQKLSGVVMTAIGIITPIVLDGDATFSLIALPLGIYLMVTKSHVMDF